MIMFCCVCNIEKEIENDGIELGTFSNEKDKSEKIDDVSTKRKKWYLDRSDIDFRNEKRRLEQKNLDDVMELREKYPDIHIRSPHHQFSRF